MKVKFPHSVAILVGMALTAAVIPSVSAQNINFSCSAGAKLYLDSPANPGTNYCTTSTIPDNDLLNYYSPTGILVTSSGFDYNVYQGDKPYGTTAISENPMSPNTYTPSLLLAGGTVNTVANSGSITVTTTTPSQFFEFDSVDLLAAYAGSLTYTIQGYDGSAIPADLVYTISSASPQAYSTTNTYKTVSNPNIGNDDKYVNTLVITVKDGTSGSYSRLDNLLLTIPEGGASLLYLLLAGSACFGAMFLASRGRFAKLSAA